MTTKLLNNITIAFGAVYVLLAFSANQAFCFGGARGAVGTLPKVLGVLHNYSDRRADDFRFTVTAICEYEGSNAPIHLPGHDTTESCGRKDIVAKVTSVGGDQRSLQIEFPEIDLPTSDQYAYWHTVFVTLSVAGNWEDRNSSLFFKKTAKSELIDYTNYKNKLAEFSYYEAPKRQINFRFQDGSSAVEWIKKNCKNSFDYRLWIGIHDGPQFVSLHDDKRLRVGGSDGADPAQFFVGPLSIIVPADLGPEPKVSQSVEAGDLNWACFAYGTNARDMMDGFFGEDLFNKWDVIVSPPQAR